MPFITIKLTKGRSIDQKKKLVKSVTESVAASVGVKPAQIWVQIDEFEPDNFATGGTLLSERA